MRGPWGEGGDPESTIRTGTLVVNLDTRVVSVDDKPVRLTGKEYAILELLCLRKGSMVTKEMFLDHLYGGMDEPELAIIDHFVGNLRKKLAQATGGQHYIETAWGRGHALRDPSDLPVEQRPAKHWTAEVVAAVRSREITLEEALQRHQLTEEEFRAWRAMYEVHGLPGLRATRLQQYRYPPLRRPRF